LYDIPSIHDQNKLLTLGGKSATFESKEGERDLNCRVFLQPLLAQADPKDTQKYMRLLLNE
jgi:hypothetical protein